MLASPLNLSFDSETISMVRINQDNYASVYYGTSADGLRRLTLTFTHRLPKKGGTGESHGVNLDIERYDSEEKYIGVVKTFMVMKSIDHIQNTSEMLSAAIGMTGLLTATSNAVLTALANRES
jgi:hypothetical protein